ncbi:MAG: PBP1A family penicillin-binding protein [Candidatus Daviesbacteria bacterium]|nr:MAG: PBP1A family penicillin-binding protein [Candidatus Daviesbacteria bacterium]
MVRRSKQATHLNIAKVTKITLLLIEVALITIGKLSILFLESLATTLTWTVKQIATLPNKLPSINLPAQKTKPHFKKKPAKVTVKKKRLKFAWIQIMRSFILLPLQNLSKPQRGRGRPRHPLTISLLIKKIKSRYKRIPRKVRVAILFTILMLIFFSYTSLTFSLAYTLPNPSRLTTASKPLTTEFYDRNGILLYRIYEGQNRTLVTLKDLPNFVAQSTIAIEDKNFYHHPGIDPLGILRAMIHNLGNENLEGASTLTQQLIKNTLLTPEKTFSRKTKEIILALWAERIYSKEQILQMYLNEAPYGGPAWGIEAAAQTYFGKSAKDLTLAEAAFLAGLPASPTQFSPYGTRPDLSLNRQKMVLKEMQSQGYITKKQQEEAEKETLNIIPPTNNIKAGHFVMYIKDVLSQKYGSRVVSQGGLKIYTTLDLSLQLKTEKIVSDEINNLAALNVHNGAAMITDAKTGQILAMVGARGYDWPNFGNYNTTLALRQPGSSIKVVTYLAAFNQGFSPGNTILDTPVTFRTPGGRYSPVNYDGKFHGPVSIRVALGSSYNIPAVKMLGIVGMDKMIDTARELGITTFTQPQNYGLSITLGGAEVKMIDMMSVYGTLSQMGAKRVPTGILKVLDWEGNILEQFADNPQQTVKPEVAFLVTNILADNSARTPAFGPSSLLNIPGHEVGVKTGTSDNKKDNWTFGYTPDYVVGVWVGNNDGSVMNPELTSGVTGASPIWNKLMHLLVDNQSPKRFLRPFNIKEAMVDGRRDLVIDQNPGKNLVQVRKEQDKIIFFDSFSTFSTPSAQINPN